MKKLSLIILALLVVLVSCKKAPEVNLKYVDVEREVLTIGTTTATFQCDYQYIATLKSAKIYYGLSENSMSSKEMQVVSSSLYAEITGLTSSTAYNYYYEFDNGYNTMQSGTKSFVTEASATVVLPTVITADVTDITATSAFSGGNITNDGGGNVTARGVCWSLSLNPTINDSLTTDGDEIGPFISSMTGLSGNTTYHVRAYATNEAGTAYGLDKEFTTPVAVPEGAINGLFTVNENGDKVYFSQGNLQYQASTNTWRFADNQWDYVGDNNSSISSSYNGYIDLFGWGTSGWNSGNTYYHPWDSDTIDGSLYGTLGNFDLISRPNSDWGVYNPIKNGGNADNTWRTLDQFEWFQIIRDRITESGIRYAKANVNGVNGVIILPDDWREEYYYLNNTNALETYYYDNIVGLSDWQLLLESHGAVFLPAGGFRIGTQITGAGIFCYYWSTLNSGESSAYTEFFWEIGGGYGGFNRYRGHSVRLVQDANPQK